MTNFQVGDVVQLDPMIERFGGCFMVVTEVKGWGCQGYVPVPGHNGINGVAYYRAKNEEMEFVGQSVWHIKDE